MKRGGLGGPGEVKMSFGAPVSPAEALPWQRGRWAVDGGGHSPKMPEDLWESVRSFASSLEQLDIALKDIE